MMYVLRIWRLLCLLGALHSSLSVNEVEYDGNYAENYDNEISKNQREGDVQTPVCPTDVSHWDKVFIALEDSSMRQNMLLESVEQCCSGKIAMKNLLDKLTKGPCHQCAAALESACRAQVELEGLKVQQSLVELREEETERERRLNATLQTVLRGSHEGNARLRRLELAMPAGRTGQRPTPRPEGVAMFGSGMMPSHEATLPPDVATMERALVSIATELQRLHLQLNEVIEQAGALRKDRGDT